MDSLEKLKLAIIAQVKAHMPVQTIWAECASVNIQEGTMVATREGLDYDHVLLGLGADITVPEVGSKVLLGLIENKGVATFLVYAEKIALRRINGEAFGGLVKVEELVAEINAIKQDLNLLKTAMSTWVVVPTDGGATLKAVAATWYAQQLLPVTSAQLSNPIVSHG